MSENLNLEKLKRQSEDKNIKEVDVTEIKEKESHLPTSDSEKDDYIDMELIEKKKKKVKKKFGISAEAYGEYNKIGEFKPKIIEKTEA